MTNSRFTNKSFCSLLWKHICIRPNFLQVPCCRFTGISDSALALSATHAIDLNSDDFKTIRQKMLSGEPVNGCEECYKEESLTRESLRLSSNKEFGSSFLATEVVTPELVEYLEIFVGAVCNLKCIGCSPLLSSSLHEEYKRNGWELPEISDPAADIKIEFIEKLSNLKHLKFVGGEPILNNLHDKIINSLQKIDMSSLRLTYYTNCTIWPSAATLAAWKKVGHLNLNLSIDGVGAKSEYLRKNSKWENVDKMVRQYFALAEDNQQITLQVSGTVSILNILYLEEIESWFSNLEAIYPKAKTEPVYLTYLTEPSSLSPHKAPPELIEKVIATYGSGASQQQLKIVNLLKTMKGAEALEDGQSFLTYVGRFDQARRSSFKDIFPELKSFF